MKRFVLPLATLVVCLVIIEVLLGYVLWISKLDAPSATYSLLRSTYQRLQARRHATSVKVSFLPRSPYSPDPYLGYSETPGAYAIELRDPATGNSHRFTSTIDSNGNRITSFAPKLFEGKREIWIFGDSFTYGWGNNDETTFPFFLQQYLPAFRVINYAGNGYGNIHAYLQVKRALERQRRPAVIVVVYGDYFDVRNVAAPSRLGEFTHNEASLNGDPSAFLHPRGVVEGGKLKVEYVPLFTKQGEARDPAREDQYLVTTTLLGEIHRLGTSGGAKLVLAFIRGLDGDQVVSFARGTGYAVSDIRPRDERKEWDDFLPLDGHPGPLAQNNYAIKLRETIVRVAPSASP